MPHLKSRKRKILSITGIRSEYDILSSVYRAIQDRAELELEVIVTGAHLSRMYGLTKKKVEEDGFKIADEILSLINSDEESARVKGLGIQLSGMVQTVARVKPDMLLVLGDREEAMSAALLASYMNIPLAHICGGDRVIGNVDDQIRHAVTKLAHLHFVTNQESYDRVLKLGEQPFRVFNTGNPGLDRLVQTPTLSHQKLAENLKISLKEGEPFLMVIQHSLSSETEDAARQMEATLEAVTELGLRTIVIYPNSDSGGQQIIAAIERYAAQPNISIAKHVPRLEFVNLMRKTACLIGNSSAGILEAPLLKLPVVNVGNRQKGRLCAENVNFVPHDARAIVQAVRQAVYDEGYRGHVLKCSNPYGDGDASKKIADILATIQIDRQLLIKDITY